MQLSWALFMCMWRAIGQDSKKRTNLLISNNNSSDKDTFQDNSYESESDKDYNRGTIQEEKEEEESTEDVSNEEDDLFSDEDY